MKNTKMNNRVLLYDGDCGFCNFWVKWVLKNDRSKTIHFAPLQGKFGQEFLAKNGFSLTDFNTLYFIEKENEYYTKLDAVIKMGSIMKGVFGLLQLLKIIPKFIRDFIYDNIAKNRKKLMSNNCFLPTKEERARFIE